MKMISILCFLYVALSSQVYGQEASSEHGHKTHIIIESHREPLKTKDCVKRNKVGTCKEWDYTFSVAGAHCVEDCLVFSAFDECKIRNQCTFDEKSGCFKRKVCKKVNTVDNCTKWKEEVACK